MNKFYLKVKYQNCYSGYFCGNDDGVNLEWFCCDFWEMNEENGNIIGLKDKLNVPGQGNTVSRWKNIFNIY